MLSPLRIATPLVAAVLAVTLAACGGSSGSGNQSSGNNSGQLTEAQYKQRFQPIDQDIKAVGNSVAQIIVKAERRNLTAPEIVNTFQGAHQRLTSDLDRLQALKPPASLQADVQGYVGAVQTVDGDLQKVTAAVQKHDGPAAKSATIALLTDSAKGKPAIDRLRHKLGIPGT